MRRRGGPGARPYADDSIVAAGDLGPLKRDRPGDLRERQRQHGEIDAGEPHAEPAEQKGAREAEDDSRDERGFHPDAQQLERERGAIGAETEIGGVAERNEPAGADQKMQARGKQHEDEHFRGDRGEVIARYEGEGRRRRQAEGDGASAGESGRQRAISAPLAMRTSASGRPSNHQGRSTSTTAMTRNARTIEIPG